MISMKGLGRNFNQSVRERAGRLGREEGAALFGEEEADGVPYPGFGLTADWFCNDHVGVPRFVCMTCLIASKRVGFCAM